MMHNHIDHTRYVTRYLPVRGRILTSSGQRWVYGLVTLITVTSALGLVALVARGACA